jgi:methionyl-tRNA synthetase
MLEEKEVREECLYCHGQIKLGNPCPVCGDTKLAESLRADLSPRPTLMFHPGPMFEPNIAGV